MKKGVNKIILILILSFLLVLVPKINLVLAGTGDIVLLVSDYQYDNTTANVSVNWERGQNTLDSILITFRRSSGSCLYNITSNLLDAVGDGKTYNINVGNTTCGASFGVLTLVNVTPTRGNKAPIFLKDKCNYFSWNINTINKYSFNVLDCFEDGDGDNLTIRYENNNSNVNIERFEELMYIVPKTSWVGSGNLSIYAKDSIEEKKGLIRYWIVDPSASNNNNNQSSVDATTLKIENYTPIRDSISIFSDGNKTFSIGNQNYESVKWFLNGAIVKNNSIFYEVNGLNPGNYTIKVEIKKNNQTANMIWNLVVEENTTGVTNFFKDEKNTYYIIIGAVVSLFVIFAIFILSSKRKTENEDLGNNENAQGERNDSRIIGQPPYSGGLYNNPAANNIYGNTDPLKQKLDRELQKVINEQKVRRLEWERQMYGDTVIPQQLQRWKDQVQREWLELQQKQVLSQQEIQKRQGELQNEWQEVLKREQQLQEEQFRQQEYERQMQLQQSQRVEPNQYPQELGNNTQPKQNTKNSGTEFNIPS
jgi:hypothetical protein